jgi:2-(1,2-epoxy-1,2-dihydrophenyl)acetyl-CoA isomerase
MCEELPACTFRSFLSLTGTNHERSAVLTAVENGVGTISLNRPEARNALSLEMRDGLARAVVQMRDDANVHTVILTGAGGAFCSGGDIGLMMNSRQDGVAHRERMRALHQWFPSW